MSFLYRFAITVVRKQPYVDWANSFDDGIEVTLDMAHENRTIYLVPETAAEPDRATLLDEYWPVIFEEELAAWMEAEKDWPDPLTREMFDAWFDVEVTASVVDLAPDQPLTQREVEAIDLDDAIHRCAWCDAEVEDGAGRLVGFKLADRGRFAARAGLTIPLVVDDERTVVGIMSADDSDIAASGEDIVFRACTGRCERALRSAVPKALRRAFRH